MTVEKVKKGTKKIDRGRKLKPLYKFSRVIGGVKYVFEGVPGGQINGDIIYPIKGNQKFPTIEGIWYKNPQFFKNINQWSKIISQYLNDEISRQNAIQRKTRKKK